MLVIEDCAEAFSGLDYLGDPRADVSAFSFGGIKFVMISSRDALFFCFSDSSLTFSLSLFLSLIRGTTLHLEAEFFAFEIVPSDYECCSATRETPYKRNGTT